MIFDGKQFAREIEADVRDEVLKLTRKPRVVSVLVGHDPASELYTRLKRQAAERVEIQFEVKNFDSGFKTQDLRCEIVAMAQQEDVAGVMIQLPIPNLQGQALQDVLRAIPLTKDIDGLRWEESGVMPATVRAVLRILEKIEQDSGFRIQDSRTVVVGARGAVGRPLVHFLKERGVKDVSEVEWDTPEPTRTVLEGDVVVSCVGKPGLITGEMVKVGVIAVDVGMSTIVNSQISNPKSQTDQDVKNAKPFDALNLITDASRQSRVVGDMTKEVYEKASVAVAVPGGVGPVTIACLMENVVHL
jgi:methylenetetrahydrofolate dehydrogenase (NADP+)/methenyltetrahydrofolate cyclohydrolase